MVPFAEAVSDVSEVDIEFVDRFGREEPWSIRAGGVAGPDYAITDIRGVAVWMNID
jgi:hypothetical protein